MKIRTKRKLSIALFLIGVCIATFNIHPITTITGILGAVGALFLFLLYDIFNEIVVGVKAFFSEVFCNTCIYDIFKNFDGIVKK